MDQQEMNDPFLARFW